MKRTAIILSFSVGFIFNVFGQDSLNVKSRNFISVSFGASFATGKYGATNSTQEGSGFATSGFQYQFEFAGFVNKNVGFGFEFGKFSNGVNQYAFQNNFYNYYQANITPPATGKIQVPTVDSWKVYYLLVGPYVTVPLKNLFIDFKALGGLVNSGSADFTYVVPGLNFSGSNATSNAATSFGYVLGTNLRLKMSKSMQIKFGAEYFQTYAKASASLANNNTFNMGTQNISTFNLSWGVVFLVGK